MNLNLTEPLILSLSIYTLMAYREGFYLVLILNPLPLSLLYISFSPFSLLFLLSTLSLVLFCYISLFFFSCLHFLFILHLHTFLCTISHSYFMFYRFTHIHSTMYHISSCHVFFFHKSKQSPFLVSVSLFITLSSSFSCQFQHNIRRMTIIHRTNLANQLMRTSISRCTSVFVQSGLSNAFDFQSFYIYHINTSNHSNSFVQQTSSTINESRTRNIHHCAHQLQISLLRRSNTISSRLNLYL